MLEPTALRRLGCTDLRVSTLSLGGTAVGGLFRSLSDDAGVDTVRAAWDGGIRYFDTAPYYGHGASERRYGKALGAVPRDDFVLSTKVGRLLVPRDGSVERPVHFKDDEPYQAVFDYTPRGIERSLAMSRERLGLERLDIVYIHDAHDHTGPAMHDAYPVLDAMRARGEVGAIGIGINWIEPCMEMLARGRFDVVLLAGRYTLLEQPALDAFLPHCQRHGIGVVAGGCFNSGILASGAVSGATYQYTEAGPTVVQRVRAIQALCDEHGVSLPAAALQFPLAHPAVSSVVVGARSPEEVQANLAALREPVAPAFWAALKRAGVLRADAPVPD